MREIIGTIFGVAIMAIGFAGLGVALAQMTTHGDPNGTILSVAGLGVFAATSILLAVLAR